MSKYKNCRFLSYYCNDLCNLNVSLKPFQTSYDTLRSLLSRAFDLSDHFRLAYLCSGDWLPLLSDWDLDAAVLCASEPSLRLGKANI